MAGRRKDPLASVRGYAQRAVAENAAALNRLTGGEGLSLEARAQRPWDLVAKAQVIPRIYGEEKARAVRDARAAGLKSPDNNRFDAMRHARASERLTRVVGPELAEGAGLAVEGLGMARNVVRNLQEQYGTRDPHAEGYVNAESLAAGLSSARMDLINNAEGRRAAVAGRPIRMEALRQAPDPTLEYEAYYDAPPYSRTGLPPR